MINEEELTICRRRGHIRIAADLPSLNNKWQQCKACGMWVRQVCKWEEQQDEPPEQEMDSMIRLDRKIQRLKRDEKS